MSLVDLFFPKFNANYTSCFCYLSENDIINQKAKSKYLDYELEKYLDQIIVCSNFDNPIIHDLILRLKYTGQWAICYDLAKLVDTQIHNILVEKLDKNKTLIVPIPPDKNRLLQRGFHAPDIISLELSKIWNISKVDLVIKNTNTKPQFHLNRKKRLTNLINVFEYNHETKINLANYDNIILVDDVSTTGSTFLECAKAIKDKFPFLSISAVAVAGN